jgi:hypothetical protein
MNSVLGKWKRTASARVWVFTSGPLANFAEKVFTNRFESFVRIDVDRGG